MAPNDADERAEASGGRRTLATQADRLVSSDLEEVWALVTDINLPAMFSAELEGTEWLDGDQQPRVGAKFVGCSWHESIGRWETVSTITQCEPPRVFEWAVGRPERPSAVWRFSLAAEDGGTRLALWMQLGPERGENSGTIDASPHREPEILRRRLHEHHCNIEACLDGIAKLAVR